MAIRFDVPLSLASCSIGLPKHTFHQKIEAITQAGFTGIEISLPDILSFATTYLGREVESTDYDALCEAASQIANLCEGHDLKIMLLQPFANFEGWPDGSEERRDAFDRARGWIRIMEALGADTLQVGSSDSEGISSSVAQLAGDLGQLADMLAEKGFRLAYENWCWSTHAPSWKDVWTIVQEADRPNIGLCLDTFQTAGGEWGDPTTESGRIESGGISQEELDFSYGISLQELTRTVPADRIYLLQISDAYRVSPPLRDEKDASGLRPRGRWSHDYRPLPYDGGYLPITHFAEAVLATGFRGWFSVEVFDGLFEKKYGNDLQGFAKKARDGCVRMLEEIDGKRALTGLE
ncbi:hypothetical protein VUR80DRAFT_4188 [Thermomyces stellatus]